MQLCPHQFQNLFFGGGFWTKSKAFLRNSWLVSSRYGGGCFPVILWKFQKANSALVPTRGSVLQNHTSVPSETLPRSGSVIWVRCWGWRKNQNSWGTGKEWPRTWGILWGCRGPHCVASTAAPRSPWIVSCWPWTPSPGTPAVLPALWKVALNRKPKDYVESNSKKLLFLIKYEGTRSVLWEKKTGSFLGS